MTAHQTHDEACHKHDTSLVSAAHATLHCLTGCAVGEILGLFIGVSAGLGPWATMGLAIFLAYVFGFAFTLGPLMRREGLTLQQAMSIVWIGELVSITAMEIGMNVTAYAVGGVHAKSIFEPVFWIGMIAAIPAGFLAAWPVNYWLLKRQLKKCH